MLTFHKLSVYVSSIIYGDKTKPKYTYEYTNYITINRLNITCYILYIDDILYIDYYYGTRKLLFAVKCKKKTYQVILEWFDKGIYHTTTLKRYSKDIERLYKRFV